MSSIPNEHACIHVCVCVLWCCSIWFICSDRYDDDECGNNQKPSNIWFHLLLICIDCFMLCVCVCGIFVHSIGLNLFNKQLFFFSLVSQLMMFMNVRSWISNIHTSHDYYRSIHFSFKYFIFDNNCLLFA